MAVVRWSIEIVIFWEIKRRVGIECDARLEESLTGNGLQVKFVATGGIVRRRIGDAVLVLDADAEAVVAVRVQIADVAATAPDSRTDLLPVAVWAFAHFHVVSDGDARADGDRRLPRQSQVPLVDQVDDGTVGQRQRSSRLTELVEIGVLIADGLLGPAVQRVVAQIGRASGFAVPLSLVHHFQLRLATLLTCHRRN